MASIVWQDLSDDGIVICRNLYDVKLNACKCSVICLRF